MIGKKLITTFTYTFQINLTQHQTYTVHHLNQTALLTVMSQMKKFNDKDYVACDTN